jgi:hypothetical protein
LLPVLLASLAVGVAMGYGRGRYPNLLDSRYHTLLMPIGLVTYLLLVGRPAWFVPQLLALIMALCTGWNWPDAIAWPRGHREKTDRFTKAIRQGRQSLSTLAVLHGEAVGYLYPKPLLDHLQRLRCAHLGVFKDDPREYVQPEPVWYARWEAETGEPRSGLSIATDESASGAKVIEHGVDQPAPGSIRYQVEVPADAQYLLWGQVSVPLGVPTWSVQVDDGPETAWPLVPGSGYHPCVLDTPLTLSAGKHQLTLRITGVGIRLDHLQMMTFVQ